MGRQLRIQLAGAIYHIVSLGNRREAIFTEDADREQFLATLAEACRKTDWQVHAFCLLPDQVSLVIETPHPNLVAGMHWLQGQYAARYNRRHGWLGHVFAGRYRAVLIEGTGPYLALACDQVHLAPVWSGLLGPETPLRSFRWSSLPSLLGPAEQRPAWLRADRLLAACEASDTEAGRLAFEQRLEKLRHSDLAQAFGALERGWCLGSDAFKRQVLAQLIPQLRAVTRPRAWPELAEEKARQIVQEELARRGWSADQLRRMRKGDPRKLPIVHRLRAETPVTLAWIARELHMGTREYLVHLLYWENRPKPKARLEPQVRSQPTAQPQPATEPEQPRALWPFPWFDPSFD